MLVPVYTIFPWEVVCFGSHGLSEVFHVHYVTNYPLLINFKTTGSGSTYVYGYCDATYKEGWGREETVDFVRNSLSYLPFASSYTRLTPLLSPGVSYVP